MVSGSFAGALLEYVNADTGKSARTPCLLMGSSREISTVEENTCLSGWLLAEEHETAGELGTESVLNQMTSGIDTRECVVVDEQQWELVHG